MSDRPACTCSPVAAVGRAVRRVLSIAALVAVDILGLALGLYAALVLRTLLYGGTLYWSILWQKGVAEWLPFLAPITVLVFAQAGLYAVRERRPGAGRIVSSLILVALIVLAFGYRDGIRLQDDRADPDRRRHLRARASVYCGPRTTRSPSTS